MRVFRGLVALIVFGAVLAVAQPAAAATQYYVDCVAGDDTNSGRSGNNAWRSLSRANQAELEPGDTLRLKRGCSFEGRLDVSWNGTAASPITVATYGSGPKPIIWNDGVLNSAVKVTGSHLEIRALEITFEQTSFDPCGQPLGTFYGINFTDGARFVKASKLEVSHGTVGAHLSLNSSDITLVDNLFRDNNVMNVWGGNPSKELGAWGVLIRGDRNVIAHNEFRDNVAVCLGGNGKYHSNSAEIFGGDDNYIHSNRSNDRVFSELGGSSGDRAEDNVFEHNTHVSSIPQARFITTRGSASSWGPVRRTIVDYNTVKLTGADSVAISCGQGCNTNILTLRHNTLSATEKALFTDDVIVEEDNVYWNPSGDPRIQYDTWNKLYTNVPTPVLNNSIVGNPNTYSPQPDSTPPPGPNGQPPTPTTTTAPPTTTVPSSGGAPTVSNGAVYLTTPPTTLAEGSALDSNTNTFVFLEANTTLAAPLTVNRVTAGSFTGTSDEAQTIPAGTAVCSYFVQADRLDDNGRLQGAATFDSEILGLIYTVSGLEASDGLRNPNVAYKRGGVEGNDFLELSSQSGASTITWDMRFGAGLDQMRIIVACP